MTVPSVPFRILALAPLAPRSKDPFVHPVPVDTAALDAAVAAFPLSFTVAVPGDLCPDRRLDVEIRRFKDFHPDGLLSSQPFLARLADARDFVRDAAARGLSDEAVREHLRAIPGLPPIVPPRPPAGTPPGKSTIDDILRMVALPQESSPLAGEMRNVAARIESILEGLLRHVFSDPDFRIAESAWRGVSMLLRQGIGDGDLSLELVPVHPDTLEETLDRLTVTCAEDLPSLVLIDLPFDNTPRRVELLEKVALFAETLLAPTICWVTPEAFGIDGWKDLPRLAYLPNALDVPAFAKLRRLQGLPSARWVAVTCNRFLARLPYGPDNKPSRIRFDEAEGVYASPVWAIGALIAQSVRKHGWPTRFTEWQKIRLENLPVRAFTGTRRIPSETVFPEDRLLQFPKAGFTPLAAALDMDIAFAPVEATLGRGSLRYQLLLAQIIRLLIWCKENLAADLAGEGLEDAIRRAFGAMWEKAGHSPPASLEVTATSGEGEEKGRVRITLDPSREVLPTGERIELEFPW